MWNFKYSEEIEFQIRTMLSAWETSGTAIQPMKTEQKRSVIRKFNKNLNNAVDTYRQKLKMRCREKYTSICMKPSKGGHISQSQEAGELYVQVNTNIYGVSSLQDDIARGTFADWRL